MNLLKRITLALLMAMCVISLNTACSDDDKDGDGDGGNGGGGSAANVVDPSSVFTNGMPKSINEMVITTDEDGLVIKMEDQFEAVTFDYAPKMREALKGQAVKMSIVDKEYPKNNTEFLMLLNNNGFVTQCVQRFVDGSKNEQWAFHYTTDGYLNGMVRSEGDNEVTTITYKDGNITKVSMKSDEKGEDFETEIFYTSDIVSTAIENKGNVMLHDETFGIDMDEMAYAYYAGMLGKATKHLPVKMVETEDGQKYTTNFDWTLNKNNFPEKLVVKDQDYSDEYLFVW